MAFAVLIVAMIMGTTTVVTLTCIWLGTSYSLKKRGYRPEQAKETYNKLQSELKQISVDIDEIRSQLADLVIMNHDRITSKIRAR